MKSAIIALVLAICFAKKECQISECDSDEGHCHSNFFKKFYLIRIFIIICSYYWLANPMDRNIMLQVSQRTECFYARN